MPSWQTIRDTIISHPVAQFGWRQVKKLGIASESPKTFGLIAFAGVAGLVWMNIHVPGSPEPLITESEMNEATQTEAAVEPEPEPYVPPEERFTLKRGETLITLLKRASIDTQNAHLIVNRLKGTIDLRRMQAGQEVRLTRRADDGRAIAELKIRDSFSEESVVRFDDGAYRSARETLETQPLTYLVEGEITDSLYLSAAREGLPTNVIVELIRLLSFDVDFEREIRVGDRFQVYFQRNFAPDFGDIENGRILRVQLQLQKRTLDAFYYEDADGDGGYFDAEGQSTKRALMKTPLDVVYVTDSYGPRKKHPVLGYRTMHTGTDFRARPGTPIMASGDGVIEMAARNGGYGKYIRIRHNGTYKTAYAHLSRYGKGIKKGRRVKQGQIIGYSGATGRVNGPHLHYEVHVNGKPVNPLTLKLPSGKKLSGQDMEEFQRWRDQYLAEIDTLNTQKDILLVDSQVTTQQLSE